MAKSYKKNSPSSSLVKSTRNNIKKALPVVDDGLKTAAFVAKGVAKDTIPIFEKGVSAVYGTMDKGLHLGMSGVKNVGKSVKNVGKTLKGGRRSRRRRSSRRRRY